MNSAAESSLKTSHAVFNAQLSGINPRFLSFYFLNATSLAKNNAVQHLACDIKSNNIDVCLIAESWFRPNITDDAVAIDNYFIVRRDRCNRKGGGVCAYVRVQVYCKVINDGSSSINNALEILWLLLQFNEQTYVVACCYHPPKPVYNPSVFKTELSTGLEYIILNYPSAIVIIAGDFNSLDTNFLEYDFGFLPLVNMPTHGNKILDKVFVSQPGVYVCKVVKSIVKTKHMAIVLSAESESVNSSTARRKVKLYDLKPHNITRLQHAIGVYDWNQLLTSSCDISDIYDGFLNVIHSLIDLHIPSHIVTMGNRDPDYVTPMVKFLLNKRRLLRKKGRTSEADELADRINILINQQRQSRLSKLADATPKELWASVNLKRHTSSSPCNDILLSADNVNKYFSNIATDPEYNTQRIKAFFKTVSNADESDYCDSEILVNDYDIEPMLRHLKNSSPGIDGLPAWLFRACSYELSTIVARVFNMSFQEGNVPSQWLLAIVTPVPKVPHPKQLNDFRPISVTPLLSRIAEKIVVTRWLRPAIPNATIRDQFAFKPSGSTTCAIVYFMHHVTRFLETNNYVRFLCIDFSKAFDTVSHDILIAKLSKLRLPRLVFNWIISFLSDRSQVCKLDGKISAPCKISRSIIQGSGIGPTLYIVMEGDLHPLSCINLIFKYANDTNLLVPENTDVDIKDEYEHIKQWAAINKMCINESKTKELVFHRPCPRKFHIYNPIDGIERVNQVKLLGVIVQDNFNVDAHVNYVLAVCSQRIFLLKKLRDQGLSLKYLQIIFQALIVSRLLYALPAWGCYLSAELTGRIDAFLKRSYKYGVASTVLTVSELMDSSSYALFIKMQNTGHCLYDILPSRDDFNVDLRPRGHCFKLPVCFYNLYKKSFLNRCLFEYK